MPSSTSSSPAMSPVSCVIASVDAGGRCRDPPPPALSTATQLSWWATSWSRPTNLKTGAPTSASPPQLLRPEDPAWVLATEIEWDSTIVADSRAHVDSILAANRLEAHPVDEDADLP